MCLPSPLSHRDVRVCADVADWVKREYPAIQLVEVEFSEYLPKLNDGTCDAFVVDRPIALQMAADNCDLNLGVGPSTTYGYHDCAFGLKSELTDETVALSYWIEWLRTCSPNDATDARCARSARPLCRCTRCWRVHVMQSGR